MVNRVELSAFIRLKAEERHQVLIKSTVRSQYAIIFTYLHQAELFLRDGRTVRFNKVVELQVFRILGRFAVDVYLVIS